MAPPPPLPLQQPPKPHQPQKLCFITIGATANFNQLIHSALHPQFLRALQSAAYSHLVLQHGTEGTPILDDFLAANPPHSPGRYGLDISGFTFNARGLGAEMRAAKGSGGAEGEGVVISHAGSGTILDALRIAVPIVVVPNPDLLDNHQVELAEQLAKQGYVVYGHLDDLPSTIPQSELLRQKRSAWPPLDTNLAHDPSGRGLAGVMDDEMGFVD